MEHQEQDRERDEEIEDLDVPAESADDVKGGRASIDEEEPPVQT